MTVVIMWKRRSGNTTLSHFGIRNKIPISISNRPKQMRNVVGSIKGMVFLRSASTRPEAGLKDNTFKNPNQKNTKKIENRANGIEIFLKK